MKPNLTNLLHSTVQDNKTAYAEDANLQPWAAWEKAGILVPGPLRSGLFCEECNGSAEIVWLPGKNGKDVCMRCCSMCGPEKIDPLKLRTWTIQIDAIVEKLAVALEIPSPVLPVIPDLVWKLGTKKGWTIFYLRRFWKEEKRGILAEFARFAHPIVICGNNIACENLVYDYAGQCFSLEKVANLDESGNLILDLPQVMDYFGSLPELEPPAKQPPVTQNPRRADRAINIEKLVKEMERFIRSARAHALATAEHGNIELLPRPTQEELAKLTGMSKMDVSRCLKDPQAKLLRILWEQALDLKYIAK